MLTCILAHFFLWHLNIRLGKKAPSITLSQLRALLKAVLPMRVLDIQALLDLLAWIQANSSVPTFLIEGEKSNPANKR
jgi:hypothetical protein